MILAFIIRIIHYMIISFILLVPFSNYVPLLILNITWCWSLLVHWISNNDVCCLTLLEGKLRGINYQQGFLHQFVSPVYKISDKNLSLISYYVVILSMSISFYKIYPTFIQAKKCYQENGSLKKCLQILFQKSNIS